MKFIKKHKEVLSIVLAVIILFPLMGKAMEPVEPIKGTYVGMNIKTKNGASGVVTQIYCRYDTCWYHVLWSPNMTKTTIPSNEFIALFNVAE